MDKGRALEVANAELRQLEREANRLESIANWESVAAQYKEKTRADLAKVRDRQIEIKMRDVLLALQYHFSAGCCPIVDASRGQLNARY